MLKKVLILGKTCDRHVFKKCMEPQKDNEVAIIKVT